MAVFHYIARDASGQRVAGTLSVGSRREALASLSSHDLFPVEIGEVRAQTPSRSGRVRAKYIAVVYNQLAALLRSGVPLLRAIDVIRRQSSHRGLVQVLEQVHAAVQEGASLADAFAHHPKVFGDMATSIVRAGGEAGFLEEALDQVSKFTEEQADLRSRVVGALAYPAFLAVVGTTIVTVLIIFFVPKFEALFGRLREQGELPAVTEGLLALSGFLRDYGLFLAAAVLTLGLIIRSQLTAAQGRRWLDAVTLRIPGIGGILLALAVARFCRVLGTLLHGGVPILRGLDISSSATGNWTLATAIQEAAENISEGESLTRPLTDCGKFPPTVTEMIAVAEESNTLDTVLTDIADSLERQTWRRLDLMVRLLEPIMLLILATVVLIVVIALLLPVMKMSMAV